MLDVDGCFPARCHPALQSVWRIPAEMDTECMTSTNAGKARIVRLLVATLHVGMTGKQDGGYTQLA